MRIRFFGSVALQVVVTLFILAVTILILRRFGPFPDFNFRATKQGPHVQLSALSPGAWRFIVSGDSRNCGDVVMPSIAATAALTILQVSIGILGTFVRFTKPTRTWRRLPQRTARY